MRDGAICPPFLAQRTSTVRNVGIFHRKVVLRHSISDIERALSGLGLGTEQINAEGPGFTVQDLVDYFVFRADLD